MHILDSLLLALGLLVFLSIAVARMTGKLPGRGLRRWAEPVSTPEPSGHTQDGMTVSAAGQRDNFKGILVHHAGPVRFLQPNYPTS